MKKMLSVLITISVVFALVGCSSASPNDTVSSYLDSFKNRNVEESDNMS